jgi:hypothetical protein
MMLALFWVLFAAYCIAALRVWPALILLAIPYFAYFGIPV